VRLVEAARGIDLLADEESPSWSPKENHKKQQGNPHVWLDPLLAKEICRRIAEALADVDPDHRYFYRSQLRHLLHQMDRLHEEITRRVKDFSIREYVCFHPSFAYFSRRYGLRRVGVIKASPDKEPTPRRLREIVQHIRSYRIRVVFAEPQLNSRLAEVIAREAGVEVLMLDPIGGRPPYGSDYFALMRHNLSVMESAMR
jgi:zinc transport system substrate-binding protein